MSKQLRVPGVASRSPAGVDAAAPAAADPDAADRAAVGLGSAVPTAVDLGSAVPTAADLDAATQAAADFGAATDFVDEAVAVALGVNRTDLRILGLVSESGPLSAAALAGAAKLSPAATTTAIQRLVAARHLTRTVDQDDRRRAVVALTPYAEDLIDRAYGPIARAGRRILASYSAAELALIIGFLRRGIDMQLAEADRIRALPRQEPPRES